MNSNKRGTRLYNVLFPIWMLKLLPPIWLIVLPGNFIIDSLVLILGARLLKITDKKRLYKRHILPVWGFGFLSDLIGSAYLFFIMAVFQLDCVGDELYLTIPAIAISAAMIFVCNYFVTFRKTARAHRWRLSLILAITTAPYTFLIPTRWLY